MVNKINKIFNIATSDRPGCMKFLFIYSLLIISTFGLSVPPASANTKSEIVAPVTTYLMLKNTVVGVDIFGDSEAPVGTNISLQAFVTYENGQVEDVTSKVIWSSDSEAITVDNNGIVSATVPGKANITAAHTSNSTSHPVSFTEAVLDYLEIQEGYVEGGNGKIITDTTQTIELVNDVSYPSDPGGLSPNAYYPTVWAVYTNGQKVYVNQEAFWGSSDFNAAYVNYLKGSFVFGIEIQDNITITAGWEGITASFKVNVVGQTGRTLESIVINNGWTGSAIPVTEVDVEEGDRTPLVAYGWFVDNSGNRTFEYINQNVFWSSSDLTKVWIEDYFSSYAYGIKENTSATITATWQGVSAYVTVNVLPSSAPTLNSIEIQKGYNSDGNGQVIDGEHPLFMLVDEVQYVTAWGNYSDGVKRYINTSVFWSSQNYAVASMDLLQRNSDVAAVALGSTTISATLDGVTGLAPVSVVTIEDLVIHGTDELPIGTTTQLNAIATLYDGTNTFAYPINDAFVWTPSDSSIATVNPTGLVTAIGEGHVTITATAKNDNTLVATKDMAVVPATLQSIQIEKGYNPAGGIIINTLDVTVGSEEYITAWGIYSDGSRRYINTDTVWWSSDQQVASINYLVSSNVYGRDLGTADVTAYFGGENASVEVTVQPVSGRTLQQIEIRDGWSDPTDITDGIISIEVGASAPVVAYGHYSDGSTEDINNKVTWSSSDLSTAFILDEIDSYVHGIKIGSATITAEWQGVSAFVTANIIASTAPTLDSIEIQKGYVADGSGEIIDSVQGSKGNPLILPIGDVQYVTAWGNYSDGSKKYINTEVFWLSDNNSIASMPLLQTSSNVTGVAIGSTTISAALSGVTAAATVDVTP